MAGEFVRGMYSIQEYILEEVTNQGRNELAPIPVKSDLDPFLDPLKLLAELHFNPQ